MELATWKALKQVLPSELHWQRAFRFSTLVTFGTLMEQVLRKALLAVVRELEPRSVSTGFETALRSLIRARRGTAAERGLYSEIARQPSLHGAFKPLSRTDCFPRLRVSAVG